jgi:hypothetical protein
MLNRYFPIEPAGDATQLFWKSQNQSTPLNKACPQLTIHNLLKFKVVYDYLSSAHALQVPRWSASGKKRTKGQG